MPTHSPARARTSGVVPLVVQGSIVACLVACGGDGPSVPDAPRVAQLEIVLPTTSIVIGDSALATARALDSAGRVVPGQTLSWSSSDASVVEVSSTGMLRAKGAGIAQIGVTTAGASAAAPVCARGGAARVEIVAGADQTGTILGPVPQLPVVRVADSLGRPIPCLTVTISPTPSDAVVEPKSATTDADGRIRITKWTLGRKAGPNTLTLSWPEGAPASISATAEVGPPTAMAIVSGDAQIEYMGRTFAPLVLRVHDAGDNPVAGVAVTFAATGPRPVLSRLAATTDSLGLATVGARLDSIGSGVVDASATGVAGVSFHLEATGMRAKKLVMGGARGCALGLDDVWYCWGWERSRAAPLQGSAGLTDVTIGTFHVCGMMPGTIPTCWGGNSNGELGIGRQDPPPPGLNVTPLGGPVRPLGIGGATAIVAGNGNTCALVAGGAPLCWGYNQNGQLGLGYTSITDETLPKPVLGSFSFRTMFIDIGTTCALDAQSVLYCWGWNGNGNVGDGTLITRTTPTLATTQTRFASISGSCALTSDGSAYCWGYNGIGNVGDGTNVNRTVPTAVVGGVHFKSLSTGGNTNCGIALDDRLYCWGLGWANQPSLVTLPRGQTVRAMGTSLSSVCVIADTDRVYCWGQNTLHELGDGTTTDHWSPGALFPPVLP